MRKKRFNMPYIHSLPSKTYKTLNGEFSVTQERQITGNTIKTRFNINTTGQNLEKTTDWVEFPQPDPVELIKKAMPTITDSLPLIQTLDIDKDRIYVCSAFLLKGGKEIKLYLPIADTVERLKSLISRHDKTQLSDGERVYNINYKDIEALIID